MRLNVFFNSLKILGGKFTQNLLRSLGGDVSDIASEDEAPAGYKFGDSSSSSGDKSEAEFESCESENEIDLGSSSGDEFTPKNTYSFDASSSSYSSSSVVPKQDTKIPPAKDTMPASSSASSKPEDHRPKNEYSFDKSSFSYSTSASSREKPNVDMDKEPTPPPSAYEIFRVLELSTNFILYIVIFFVANIFSILLKGSSRAAPPREGL